MAHMPDEGAVAQVGKLKRHQVYGLRLDWRTFAEELVLELMFAFLGLVSLPIQFAVLGWNGAKNKAFVPGRYLCGNWNLVPFGVQYAVHIFLLPVLVRIIVLPLVDRDVKRMVLVSHLELAYVFSLLFVRQVTVALKGAFNPRWKTMLFREHMRTLRSYSGELMVRFAAHAEGYMLFDQLHAVRVEKYEQALCETIRLLRPISKNVEVNMRQAYQDALRVHTFEAGAIAGGKSHIANLAAAIATEEEDMWLEVAEEGEKQRYDLSLDIYLFDIISKVFTHTNAQGLVRTYMKLAILLPLLEVAVVVDKVWILSNMGPINKWDVITVCSFGLLRSFHLFLMNLFLVNGRVHFRRLRHLLIAHLQALAPITSGNGSTTGTGATWSPSATVAMDTADSGLRVKPILRIWVPSMLQWMYCFDVLRNYGAVFTFRYSMAVALNLIVGLGFAIGATMGFVESTDSVVGDIAGRNMVIMLTHLAFSLSAVALTLWEVSRYNAILFKRYPRALMGFQAEINLLRYRLQHVDPGADSEELSQVRKLLGRGVSLGTYMDDLYRCGELVFETVQQAAPVFILGIRVNESTLKSSLPALLSVLIILLNAGGSGSAADAVASAGLSMPGGAPGGGGGGGGRGVP